MGGNRGSQALHVGAKHIEMLHLLQQTIEHLIQQRTAFIGVAERAQFVELVDDEEIEFVGNAAFKHPLLSGDENVPLAALLPGVRDHFITFTEAP